MTFRRVVLQKPHVLHSGMGEVHVIVRESRTARIPGGKRDVGPTGTASITPQQLTRMQDWSGIASRTQVRGKEKAMSIGREEFPLVYTHIAVTERFKHARPPKTRQKGVENQSRFKRASCTGCSPAGSRKLSNFSYNHENIHPLKPRCPVRLRTSRRNVCSEKPKEKKGAE